MTNLRILTMAALLGASAIAATPASADEFDARQYRQSARIEQGVRSGQLTRQEAFALRREHYRIAEMIRAARRDGRVDRFERNRIEAAQDAASRHIFFEKHDGEQRGRRFGHGHGFGYGYGYGFRG
jgi:uncharacterized membrane protein YebE (DUF533 family)